MSDNKTYKYWYFYFFLIFSLLVSLGLIEIINKNENNPNKMHSHIQKKINSQFSNIIDIGDNFKYIGDSLIYWSNHHVPMSLNFDSLYLKNFANIGNGYYLISNQIINDTMIIYTKLIKHENNINNKYLNSDFDKSFNLKGIKGLKISLKVTDYPIYLRDKLEFYLDFSQCNYNPNSFLAYLSSILYFFIFYIISKKTLELRYFRNKFHMILPLIVLILTKEYFKNIGFPNIVYNSILFSPFMYASSSFFSSLGEMIISLIILNSIINSISLEKSSQRIRNLTSILIIPITILNVYFVQDILLNSNIDISIDGIINLDPIVYISHLILIFGQYIYIKAINKLIHPHKHKYSIIYLYLLFLISALISIFFIKIEINIYSKYLIPILLFIIFIILIFTKLSKDKNNRIISYISLMIILSFYIGSFVFNYNESEKRNNIISSLKKISQATDPETEIYLSTLNNNFLKDSLIQNILKSYDNEKLENYIRDNYLISLNNNYHIGIIACNTHETIILSLDNTKYKCRDYFSKRLSNAKKINGSDNIYIENSIINNRGYIGLFKLKTNFDSTYILIDCIKKRKSNEMGYPDLLLDEKNLDNSKNEVLNYGKFINNKFVFQYGNSSFPKITNYKSNTWLEDNNNNNIYIIDSKEDNSKWISMIPKPNVIDFLSFASYIFLISTFSLGFAFIILHPSILIRFRKLNIVTSMEITIIGIFILSFLIFGNISLKYYSQMNLDSNRDVLLEKTQSISFELEKILNEDISFDSDFSTEINNLSNAYLTDINIYNNNGYLINSSRYGIFNNKLISEFINPIAFKEIKNNASPIYTFDESIGLRKYLASYMPINHNNKVIAYLHIPFIVQQKNLEEKVNQFITGYSNLYILWIILSIFIAYIISKFITSPLRNIKDSMSKINLGEKNEKINFERDDELGDLIKSYNIMVDKLEASAIELQKSEREQAWRELAKQVAHDIKNPLTPLKLSIQHLQRIQKTNTTLFNERFEEVSNSMIDQISTLSEIVNEFSDYSKSKSKSNQISELNECITHVVDIYKTKTRIINIHNNTNNNCLVKSDKQQIIRIFNNIIKNSIQAIEKDEKGYINIIINEDLKNFFIKIKDNGIGISIENQNKIFSNEFTTKKDGTGIGLSIVKSLIESIGGKITFESEENKGTEFNISLPKLNQ